MNRSRRIVLLSLTTLAALLNGCAGRDFERPSPDSLALGKTTYAEIIASPASWVEITANERHPGGTNTQTDVAAGVLDSKQGRIVSIPRRVNGELYGSFLPGTQQNLQRALDGLIEFLPSRNWFDQTDSDTHGD